MKRLYITRKNTVSHYAIISPVMPTGFSGAIPDYQDGTEIVEVELKDFESAIGKTISFGEVVELNCSDEQFNELFNN